MAKKRTRSQKIRLSVRRHELIKRPEMANQATAPAATAPDETALSTAFVPRDLVRTLISTAIVLGVLILVIVYTRMSF